jgi:hypothetical protein
MNLPRDLSKEGVKDRHHRDETAIATVVDHSETTESKFRICFRISREHPKTCDARSVESESVPKVHQLYQLQLGTPNHLLSMWLE